VLPQTEVGEHCRNKALGLDVQGSLELVLLDRIAAIRSKYVHSVPSLARPMPSGRLHRSFRGSALGVKYYQPTNQPTNLDQRANRVAVIVLGDCMY
jgi:hypothetical protein